MTQHTETDNSRLELVFRRRMELMAQHRASLENHRRKSRGSGGGGGNSRSNSSSSHDKQAQQTLLQSQP